jgi:hypothetical protein
VNISDFQKKQVPLKQGATQLTINQKLFTMSLRSTTYEKRFRSLVSSSGKLTTSEFSGVISLHPEISQNRSENLQENLSDLLVIIIQFFRKVLMVMFSVT